MTVAVRTLADDVWTILDAIANLNAYRAEIPQSTDPEVHIPPLDPDGRVHPYAVVHFGAGRNHGDRLGSSHKKTAWRFSLWCVGGDENRALWAVDAVRAALTGTRIQGAILRETFDQPDPHRSDGIQPARFSVPMGYELYVCG